MLTGPVEQQDVEIAALYRDAQVNFGKKNILGVLATRNDNSDHTVYKRQANFESTTTENPTTTLESESVLENFIYEAKGKGLLYTAEAPILKIRGNKSGDDVIYSLDKHAIVTADSRSSAEGLEIFRLIIKFIVPDRTVSISVTTHFTLATKRGEKFYNCESFVSFSFYLDSHQVCVQCHNFQMEPQRS